MCQIALALFFAVPEDEFFLREPPVVNLFLYEIPSITIAGEDVGL